MVVFNKGRALTFDPKVQFPRIAEQYRIAPAAIDAIWKVESSGRSFYAGGALKCKPELHYVYKLLPESERTSALKRKLAKVKWNDPDPVKLTTMVQRYAFLEKVAEAYGPSIAVQCASWGGPQIMGTHYSVLKYSTPMDMYDDFAATEMAQLQGLMSYLEHFHVLPYVKAKNWDKVAELYNGQGNIGVYGGKLKEAFLASSYAKDFYITISPFPPPAPPATPKPKEVVPPVVESKGLWAWLKKLFGIN